MSDVLTWIGILACIAQSGMFSGLNLAVYSPSRLRLETAAEAGDLDATRVLALRRDANFTLVTILWGNVATNVLLTLLAGSLLAGIMAFLFSTVVITFVGEIVPQAYFSRHAVPIAARLSPLLRFYRFVLWPVARPVASLLDRWVGPEGIPWFREAELRDILYHHARNADNEVGRLEATGAANFLALDDIRVAAEGEPIDPRSVLALPFEEGRPVLPVATSSAFDPFLRQIAASGRKWVVITDPTNEPRFVLNVPAFLRGALLDAPHFDPGATLHTPVLVRNETGTLGQAIGNLTVRSRKPGDDVVEQDVILVWTPGHRRIITGADLLGRLLRDIVRVAPDPAG
jgi:metal transporter CNNM